MFALFVISLNRNSLAQAYEFSLWLWPTCLQQQAVCAWNPPLTSRFLREGPAMWKWLLMTLQYEKPTHKQSWYWLSHTTPASASGDWFNIKMSSYQYRKSHCGDKTVIRSSYLHNGNSYTGKTTSLYWIRTQKGWENIVSSTLWGLDQMAAIFWMTYSKAFSWMKMYEFHLKYHWNLFLRFELTIFIIGSDNGLVPTRKEAIIWTNVLSLVTHICVTQPQWLKLWTITIQTFF